jgi:hypothetical protein
MCPKDPEQVPVIICPSGMVNFSGTKIKRRVPYKRWAAFDEG